MDIALILERLLSFIGMYDTQGGFIVLIMVFIKQSWHFYFHIKVYILVQIAGPDNESVCYPKHFLTFLHSSLLLLTTCTMLFLYKWLQSAIPLDLLLVLYAFNFADYLTSP